MKIKKLKFLQFLISQKPLKPFWDNENTRSRSNGDQNNEKLTASLEKNIKMLKSTLGESSDIVYHRFTMGTEGRPEAVLIMVDGIVDKNTVNNFVIKTLMIDSQVTNNKSGLYPNYTIDTIKNTLVSVGGIQEAVFLRDIIDNILAGDTVLVINGFNIGLIISTRGWKSRGIEQPETESGVRGPHDGFTETLRINTALIRRRIRNPALTFESFIIGKRTKTDIAVVYLKGIVKPGLVEEIKKRLQRIDNDAILESGYIEQFIEDAPLSPFSTIGNTERPDIVAAKLLEGRAAIITDGTPVILTMPMIFLESFQAAEDYYSRPYYVSIVRALRFLSFFISVFGPASFVALTSFHQELIPTPLLLTMAAAREGTPFPSVIEATLMGIAFEILREAGIRLPRPVGTAISIVGALVIGDAVVSAGLIGAPMVIVVAITAIASFVVPPQADVGGIARIILVFMAGFLGAFGIMIGLLGGLIHICALRSFGTPYFSPFAPLKISDLKDTIVRFPLWAMLTRPSSMGWNNPVREDLGNMPAPPQKKKQP
ncbi:MAG: spore germination protein [Peptococcaceae bacterium]